MVETNYISHFPVKYSKTRLCLYRDELKKRCKVGTKRTKEPLDDARDDYGISKSSRSDTGQHVLIFEFIDDKVTGDNNETEQT